MTFPNVSETTMAVYKAPLLALFTNVGSSGSATWSISKTGYSPNTELTEVLTCSKLTTDANGGISATASSGLPQIYIPSTAVTSTSGLCGNAAPNNTGSGTPSSGGAAGSFGISLGGMAAAALAGVVMMLA